MKLISTIKKAAALCFVGALLIGCDANVAEVDPNEAAAMCGDYVCPIGTAPRELRQVEGGYEIGASIDVTKYQADGAYKVFGEGSCEYACEVMQPCNEGTFPVITKDCFTCGTMNAQGQVVQGACEDPVAPVDYSGPEDATQDMTPDSTTDDNTDEEM